jgi:hypothetical protein
LQDGGDVGPFHVERLLQRSGFRPAILSNQLARFEERLLLLDERGVSTLDTSGVPVPTSWPSVAPSPAIGFAVGEDQCWWWSWSGEPGEPAGPALLSTDRAGRATRQGAPHPDALWFERANCFLPTADGLRLVHARGLPSGSGALEPPSPAVVRVILLDESGARAAEWTTVVAVPWFERTTPRDAQSLSLTVSVVACARDLLAVATTYDLWLLRHDEGALEAIAHRPLLELEPRRLRSAGPVQLAISDTRLAVGVPQVRGRALLRIFDFARDDLALQFEAHLPVGEPLDGLALGDSFLARSSPAEISVHPLDERFEESRVVVRARPRLSPLAPQEVVLPQLAAQGDLLVSFRGPNDLTPETLAIDRVRLR